MLLLQHYSDALRRNAVSPYQKIRPNFFWYLGVDALLSIFLVVGIFQFTESRRESSLHEIELVQAGAIPMSSIQMVERMRHERRNGFWLGPESGTTYAADEIVPHVLTITYLPRGTDLFSPDQPKMTVQTFDSFASFQRITHVYLDSETTELYVTKNGNTVVFDPRNMAKQIVLRPGDPAVIVINYTHQLTQKELFAGADSLKSVV